MGVLETGGGRWCRWGGPRACPRRTPGGTSSSWSSALITATVWWVLSHAQSAILSLKPPPLTAGDTTNGGFSTCTGQHPLATGVPPLGTCALRFTGVSRRMLCRLQGVANRDIKLENALLDANPRPLLKICDFGYSKVSSAWHVSIR